MQLIPSEVAIGSVYFPPLLLDRYRLSRFSYYPPLVFLALAVIYTGFLGLIPV